MDNDNQNNNNSNNNDDDTEIQQISVCKWEKRLSN